MSYPEGSDPRSIIRAADEKWKYAVDQLMSDKPYFGVLAGGLKPIFTRKVRVLRALPDNTVLANPVSVIRMTTESLMGRLASLSLRLAMRGFMRGQGKDPWRWNLAMLISTSSIVREAGLVLTVDDVTTGLPDEPSAEEIYEALPAHFAPERDWCDMCDCPRPPPPPPPPKPPPPPEPPTPPHQCETCMGLGFIEMPVEDEGDEPLPASVRPTYLGYVPPAPRRVHREERHGGIGAKYNQNPGVRRIPCPECQLPHGPLPPPPPGGPVRRTGMNLTPEQVQEMAEAYAVEIEKNAKAYFDAKRSTYRRNARAADMGDFSGLSKEEESVVKKAIMKLLSEDAKQYLKERKPPPSDDEPSPGDDQGDEGGEGDDDDDVSPGEPDEGDEGDEDGGQGDEGDEDGGQGDEGDGGGGQGDEGDEGEGDPFAEEPLDEGEETTIIVIVPTPAEQAEQDREWEKRKKEAEEIEKRTDGKTFGYGSAAGKVIERIKIGSRVVPGWMAQLRMIVQKAKRSVRTYARPSRRTASLGEVARVSGLSPESMPAILPGRKPLPGGQLWTVFDTSGSINYELAGRFLGALVGYAKANRIDEIRIMQCDTQIAEDKVWKTRDIKDGFPFLGGGGTHFAPALHRLAWDCRRLGVRPTVIYFTDLDGDFGSAKSYNRAEAPTTRINPQTGQREHGFVERAEDRVGVQPKKLKYFDLIWFVEEKDAARRKPPFGRVVVMKDEKSVRKGR